MKLPAFSPKLPEEVLAQARIHGDHDLGYFWMAPAGVAICDRCGWRYDLRWITEGQRCSQSHERHGKGRNALSAFVACDGNVKSCYYFLERFCADLSEQYAAARRWRERGYDPADEEGERLWNLFFTVDGARARRPANVIEARADLAPMAY